MNRINILKNLLLFGVTACVGETPVNRFETKAEKVFQPPVNTTKTMSPTDTFVAKALATAKSATDLSALDIALQNFEECSLKKTAQHTFCGVGITNKPTVFCMIDAPKSADEKTGQLGSGDLGILLFKMLKAVQLDIQTNTYLCPLIPWRLPGDRIPTETEMEICLPFLKRRIELINPSFLLVFGQVATHGLFGFESIAKARQQTLVYRENGQEIKSIVTFDPAMVSKAQTYRKSAWEDLQKLASYIQNN